MTCSRNEGLDLLIMVLCILDIYRCQIDRMTEPQIVPENGEKKSTAEHEPGRPTWGVIHRAPLPGDMIAGRRFLLEACPCLKTNRARALVFRMFHYNGDSMKEIPLSGERGRGMVTLVDDDCYDWACGFRWNLSTYGYACGHPRRFWRREAHMKNAKELERGFAPVSFEDPEKVAAI